eukprot:scaffold20931_cov37-Tisochrysis_lutea.AAC.3
MEPWLHIVRCCVDVMSNATFCGSYGARTMRKTAPTEGICVLLAMGAKLPLASRSLDAPISVRHYTVHRKHKSPRNPMLKARDLGAQA